MGQILHGSATTTHAVRAAIQRSKASVSELAELYHLNEKTVCKWRKRLSVEDQRMGSRDVHLTVLSPVEEAVCVAFRRHTLLPLDDCLYALQATIPHLSRSALHRLFQRHEIGRLPETSGEPKKKFKSYPIGYFHVDITEIRTKEGKLRLFVAIDRTSKFAFVRLSEKAGKMDLAQFLRDLIEAVPYTINTLLTNNGVQFTNRAKDIYAFHHTFDRVCEENGIEHRLTKPYHPWTNGQVERMNRTIKEATVKRYQCGSHDQLSPHLDDFIGAYNYAHRLKTLRGLTPSPTAFAIARAVKWVASCGGGAWVSLTTSAVLPIVIRALPGGRVLSHSRPSTPASAHRSCQRARRLSSTCLWRP